MSTSKHTRRDQQRRPDMRGTQAEARAQRQQKHDRKARLERQREQEVLEA